MSISNNSFCLFYTITFDVPKRTLQVDWNIVGFSWRLRANWSGHDREALSVSSNSSGSWQSPNSGTPRWTTNQEDNNMSASHSHRVRQDQQQPSGSIESSKKINNDIFFFFFWFCWSWLKTSWRVELIEEKKEDRILKDTWRNRTFGAPIMLGAIKLPLTAVAAGLRLLIALFLYRIFLLRQTLGPIADAPAQKLCLVIGGTNRSRKYSLQDSSHSIRKSRYHITTMCVHFLVKKRKEKFDFYFQDIVVYLLEKRKKILGGIDTNDMSHTTIDLDRYMCIETGKRERVYIV